MITVKDLETRVCYPSLSEWAHAHHMSPQKVNRCDDGGRVREMNIMALKTE